MPYKMKGYPEKWEEFEEVKRQKAIEIANTMLKEGYLEKDVIPIAAKKAKVVSFDKENQSLMVHMLKLWNHLKTYNISIN